MAARPYDIVVFGSSGFTGEFVNEELYRIQNEGRQDLKWAAAGRNLNKLEDSLKVSGIEGIDLIVADVFEQESLEAMCAQATVIINCVGPYQLYGEQVVKACISQKTNYVDITGETYFMETVAARYDEQARDAGIYIVSACGFDCIPNDLGALLLQKSFNGQLAYVESYMSSSEGSRFNIGTWESFLMSIRNHGKLTELRKQQNLPPLTMPRIKAPRRRSIFYSDVAQRWCVYFPGPDRALVLRSLRYRKDSDGINPFNMSIFFSLGSLFQALVIAIGFCFLLPMVMTDFGFKLLLKFPWLFSGGSAVSTGPSREELKSLSFSVVLHGMGYSTDDNTCLPPSSKITVKVSGIDPGYGATSAMLVQSALCFLDDKEKLPPSGGVYTPAVAFGNTRLIQNLDKLGKVKFEVIPTTQN